MSVITPSRSSRTASYWSRVMRIRLSGRGAGSLLHLFRSQCRPPRLYLSDDRCAASRREARSRPSQRVFRGSSRGRTGCRYRAGNAGRRPAAARSSAPRARAARGRARTARRLPSAARDRAITRSTRAPTCSGVSPPGHPSRKISQPGAPLVDLLGCQSLVLAVIPLDQVGVDDAPYRRAPPARMSLAPAASGCRERAQTLPWRAPAASARQAGGRCRSTECPSSRCAGR